MVNQFPEAAGQHQDPLGAAAADRLDRHGPGPDFDWQAWNPRHREGRLHPAIFIVLVNLAVVALGLTTSLGLVSLSDEPAFEVVRAPPGLMPARPPAPPVQAATPAVNAPPTTDPPSAPAAAPTRLPQRVAQSPAEPAKPVAALAIPAKAAEPAGYVLQFGAFAEPARAVRMQANLKKHGYTAVLLPSIEGGRSLQLVRVNGFRDRNEAARAADRLQQQAGLSAIIMKAPHK